MSIPVKRSEAPRPPQPLTFLRCQTCGTENSRPFQENDYIFKEIKEGEKCPKCGGTELIIVNIYVPEERKPTK